ncbi:hypothetical protein BHM03_00043168 [Ensete ventricosum]|nr:hypothetical protein BHM03_00043168 [Ensete ventricosum]
MSTGELKVLLINASGLKGADFVGTISPYVVIQYSDLEQKSRTAHDQGGDPVWNETFAFPVNSSAVDDPIQRKLTLRIMDADTYTDDDFIGQATVHVGNVIALGMEEGFAELEPAKYRVVLEDESYYGEIEVGVRFTTQVSSMQE